MNSNEFNFSELHIEFIVLDKGKQMILQWTQFRVH